MSYYRGTPILWWQKFKVNIIGIGIGTKIRMIFSSFIERSTIRLKEGDIVLNPGELFVVPKGVEHQPICSEEAHILLIEKSGTPNSGDSETAAPKQFL